VDERTARPIGKPQVLALLRKLSPDETISDISWFRFVPLDSREPEALWLVADADINRAFYGYIIVARCAGRECQWVSTSYDGDNGDAVWTDVLADAGGDGAFELITREFAGGYDGAMTRPIYRYFIHRLQPSGGLKDVSREYRDHFGRNILPRMRAEVKATIATLPSAQPVMPRLRIWAACLRAEAQYVEDDYRLRILGVRNAGIEHAVAWARSSEVEVRRFGVQALQRMESIEARRELARLGVN